MAELRAPEQNRLLGQLARMLRTTEGDIAAPEFLPRGLDVMGLVRQLMLPSAETVEKMSYGDPLFRMPTQSNIPITADREYLADVAGMAPMVPAASRATTRLSNEAADRLVQMITRNPEATAPKVLEETAMPFMQAAAPKNEVTKITREGSPIQSAVVLIGDKIFTGQTHGQALNRAIYEGVVKKEGNKYIYPKNAEVNMDLFLTNDGRIVDRLDAYKEFDIGAAETAIEKNLMQVKPASSMTIDQYIEEAEKIKSLRESQAAVITPRASLLDQPAQSVVENPFQTAFTQVSPGDEVAGLTVREYVPNIDSISASLENYEVLSGIRKVPARAFDAEYLDSLRAGSLDKRTADLSEQIKQSKEINPLIVAVDSKGAYIIEGGHRFDALMTQGRESVPAKVVIDQDDPQQRTS
jgi:uncharacterized ParB-like nuclease family protein